MPTPDEIREYASQHPLNTASKAALDELNTHHHHGSETHSHLASVLPAEYATGLDRLEREKFQEGEHIPDHSDLGDHDCAIYDELKRDSHGVPWEAVGVRWTADECPDANGYITIRIADGSPNGDIHEQPIATVYDARHAPTVAAAPELLEALELMIEAASETAPTALAMRIDKAAQHARQAIAAAREID